MNIKSASEWNYRNSVSAKGDMTTLFLAGKWLLQVPFSQFLGNSTLEVSLILRNGALWASSMEAFREIHAKLIGPF